VPATAGRGRATRDDRRDFCEDLAPEPLTDAGKTPTFVVIQPQPPPL
jgi:hypothetical protein